MRCARAGGARWARAGGSCALCFFSFFCFWWVLEVGGGRVGGEWVLGLGLLRHEVGEGGVLWGVYPRHFCFSYNRSRMRYCEGVLEAACPKG